jgi:membrane-associated phospholipid phosphatase
MKASMFSISSSGKRLLHRPSAVPGPVAFLVLAVVLATGPSRASGVEDSDPAPSSAGVLEPAPGLFLGDGYRYGERGFLERTALDLVAIPAGVSRWDGQDWGLFLSVSTIVFGMMVPFEDSFDVWVQDWVREELGPWRHQVWTHLTEGIVWGSILAALATTTWVGFQEDRPELLEMVSLMSEAFALGQIFQLVFKLSLGREGPMNGDARGVIHGPQASLGLFPAGTPSGHASSFFALLGAFVTYWDQPALTLAMVPVGLVFAASLVISDYHFISDVVWGGAMGYALGSWVVRHRRSRPDKLRRPDGAGEWLVVPWFDHSRGAAGGAFTMAF